MKKILIIVMALIIPAAFMLNGCSGKSNKANSKAAANVQVTPAGKYPIVKKPITLNVLIFKRPYIKDLKTNEFTKWYEKKTNIHLTFHVAPAKQTQQKLNLVLSSGKYPDIIVGLGISADKQMYYGKQGVFLPLNQYIDKYGYGIKQIFKQVQHEKDLITAPDGKIYGLGPVDQNPHTYYPQKMWVYKPWLDKLGLSVPKTTEQFYQMLKDFKTKDPNGNGKADEIPLSGATNGWHAQIDGFLMSAFIPTNKTGDNNYMILKNGKVDVVFNKPGWKQGLQYLHKLYAQGLLYPATFTQDKDQLKRLGDHQGVPILGAAPGGTPMPFVTVAENKKRWKNYVAIPPLKGPNGLQVAPFHAYDSNAAGFVITKACKYPAAAFRWADMMYTREVTLRNAIGIPGKQWRLAKTGEKGLNGQQAIWKLLNEPTGIRNYAWDHVGIYFNSRKLREGAVATKGSLETILYNVTEKNYKPYGQKESTVVPPLFFNADQSAQISRLQESIMTYVQEMKAQFITGKANINTGWDAYTKKLKEMGLDQYLKIYQAAYDAKYKK